MTTVLILLAHGCPPQAIVAAFRLDERTVSAWLRRAGTQCAGVQTPLVEAEQVAGGQGQADEIRVTVRGGWCGRPWRWMSPRACGGAGWLAGHATARW